MSYSPISGGPMDPLTLRLVDHERTLQQRAEADAKIDRLKDMATFSAVSESKAAAKLVDLIEGVLFSRITVLLEQDPEAEAALKILRAFNAERDVARRAAKELIHNP